MDITVRISGPAGVGTQTTGDLLGKIVTRAGLFAHSHVDAESRIRGGLNFSHLRISDRPAAGTVGRVDILVAQSAEAVEAYGRSLPASSRLLAQESVEHPSAAPFHLGPLAREAGDERAAGVAGLGAVTEMLGLPEALLERTIEETFGGTPRRLEFNRRAARLGAVAARGWAEGKRFRLHRLPEPPLSGRLWLSGSEAIALGAVAGGVSFHAGYPMSPSTGVMTALASWGSETGVHVEQAEDEVAAINMVAGASFAGARAMTATSGGGFCLMTEGVSLLGMIEAPAVIVLAQRPGPATGLPTRYAQGDLNLARHAGHGFFPRILLAPRSIPDALRVTALAFDLAERYQTPVFVLTDQHLNDSRVTCEAPETAGLPVRRHFLTAEELERLAEYRRYAWAEDGVSPLAMPGKSRHLVYADSDEHTEEGHIAESAEVADQMARKRTAKLETIRTAAWPCEPIGDPSGETLVVSWGSTYETVREALDGLGGRGKRPAHLHLRWLWPAGPDLGPVLRKAAKVVAVEASMGGEVAGLLREVSLREVDAVVTRRDGRPFEVQELADRLEQEV